MIRLVRPPAAPPGLAAAGAAQTARDEAAFDQRPADYVAGTARFETHGLYSKPPVKAALVAMHHRKCCYCEQRVPITGTLHVEHFRPKGGFRQSREQRADDRPGYYWLAYRWENLLLSCFDCNSVYKKTLFPLADPAARACSHHDDIAHEAPLFVDPVADEPRDHIRFVDDTPRAVTPRGVATIEGMQLRRPALREERLATLALFRTLHAVVRSADAAPENAELQRVAAEVRPFVEAAARPSAPFTSMIIDYVAAHSG